jgi:hypothetical protein
MKICPKLEDEMMSAETEIREIGSWTTKWVSAGGVGGSMQDTPAISF